MSDRSTSSGLQRGVLALLALTQFIVVIDGSIVNVALPTIGRSLGIGQDQLSWVVDAYLLTFGGFLLLGGRSADLLGRRRVFVTGIVVFTVASLLGGLAPNPQWLVGARAVQGLGAAIASPAALSIITTTFPAGSARNRALAVWGAVAGAGGAAGVLLGGVLTQFLGWQWVLFVNVPIGAFIVWQAPLRLPRAGSAAGRGSLREFDVIGGVLVTAASALLVFTVVEAPDAGWTSTTTLLRALAVVLLLVGFVLVERGSRSPLVPLSVFGNAAIRGSNLVALLIGMSLISAFFLITLYLQQVLRFDALQAGLAQLPIAVSIIAASTFASSLIDRFGEKTVLLGGLVFVVAGLAWFAGIDADGSFLVDVLGPSVLTGIGLGMSVVPVTVAATGHTSEQQAGLASGLVNASQQIGGAIGLAIVSAVAAATTAGLVSGDDTSGAVALTTGFRNAFLVGAGIGAAAFLLAVAALPSRKRLGDASQHSASIAGPR